MHVEGIHLIMKEFLMNKSALEFSMLNLHSEKVGLILNAKKDNIDMLMTQYYQEPTDPDLCSYSCRE